MSEKAGAELDRAVAEAVGLEVVGGGVDEDGEVWVVNEDGRTSREFRPSADLNAAFAAAERAAVFVWAAGMQRLVDGWRVYDPIRPRRSGSVQSSPALAICAAILELKAGA